MHPMPSGERGGIFTTEDTESTEGKAKLHAETQRVHRSGMRVGAAIREERPVLEPIHDVKERLTHLRSRSTDDQDQYRTIFRT